MHFTLLASILLTPLAASTSFLRQSPSPKAIFSNLDPVSDSAGIPSVHESAIQARRILQLSSIATLSSVFLTASTLERRPGDVENAPIGLMEYYALCSPRLSDPTILGVTIATTMKNAAAGSNVTLSLRYHLPEDAPPSDDSWAYLPANLPRFSLVGYIEKLSQEDVDKHKIRDCFIKTHWDASIWEPGTDIHESWWGRLIVQEVYFFGGFGDRARIGWIPIEEWQGITQEEIDEYRLVGEQGYEKQVFKKHGETIHSNDAFSAQVPIQIHEDRSMSR